MFGSNTGSGLVKPTNTNNSFEVPSGPSDTISSLAWSPVGNILAVASWDKQVRVYEIQSALGSGLSAVPRFAYSHEGPVLCVAFTKDGNSIISGGCDNKVKMYNVAQQKDQVIGTHDAPVKEVYFCDEMKMIISASWDKTVRFWNGSQPTPVCTLQLPERVYSMDLKYPLLTVATAERKVIIYNLQTIAQNQQPYKTVESKLKLQNRVISCFPDRSGFALASIEGRCSISTIENDSNKDKNFEFKCHRTNDEIFSVNAIDFHPNGVFLTGGSDGTIVIWDKDSRSRVKAFNSCNYPITAARFSATGEILAYAIGYDWSKGHEHNQPNIPVKLFVHKLQEADVKVSKVGSTSTTSNAFRRR